MPDVTLSYKGNTIATMSESGNKTIQTSGKYCEGDITIQYSKPSGSNIGDFSEYGYTDAQTSDQTLMTVTNPLGKIPKLVTVEPLSEPGSNKVGSGVITPYGGYYNDYGAVVTRDRYANYPTESLTTAIRTYVLSAESLQARRYSAGITWDTSITYRFKFYA